MTEHKRRPAWSYTALTGFETCPRRHYETRVAKRIKEPETEALRWGNSVHKALENRVKTNKPLPVGMTHWEPLVQKITAPKGEVLAEQQIALTDLLHPTGWFDKDVWVRGVIDFSVLQDDKAIALDYKTGKMKPDSSQMQLFAALMMHKYRDIKKIVTGFVWLKEKRITKETFTRDDLSRIWDGFIPRVKRLEHAFEANEWPEKPSGLCRNWCPCTNCQFNGHYKGGA